MNAYNMVKIYESFAGSMEMMQKWLDESEQENKQLKNKIDKAIKYIENNATSNYFDKEKNMFRREEDLLKILKEEE